MSLSEESILAFLRAELLTEALALTHVPPDDALLFERQREAVRTLEKLLARFEKEFCNEQA
jgi:hypothetical protein